MSEPRRGIALVIVGTAFHTPSPTLEVLADVAIVVGDDGTIAAVHPAASPAGQAAIAEAAEVVRLSPDQRLLPGMVDLHLHAPQWPQLGTGLDLPLERWLFEYTFPLEARYADAGFAADVWAHMVPTLLANGTTTTVYFGSVHERATELLAEQCARSGQRAFVGRVAMDHPEGTPEWYRDASPTAGVEASHRSIESIRGAAAGSTLVQPIITPRFIPACTDELLAGLGSLAQQTGTLVQTHCSESDWAHHYVLDRHGRSDATVLHEMGLLREGTVLAHGDHLGDDDFALIAGVGAGVAHCPLSNSYFANAVLPVRRALARGVKVGLGTDVAGGAHAGLLSQAAMAVTVSRMLEDGVDPQLVAAERGAPASRLDIAAAFHLATVGGAAVLGAPVGSFAVGRQFDAFVVDTAASGTGLRRWDGVDDEVRLFEKIVRLAGPTDITGVWVNGRRVIG
ncbi:MAG: amidohydrolase family protein [Ilumatobacteraceae bacterium]